MRITLPKHDLQEAVGKLKSVVAAKSSLSILTQVLMETGDSSVTISGTDLKISTVCVVDCSVERPGALTVSCQRLAMLLSELPDADITLDLQENNVISLTCGQMETRLFSMPPEEFPPIRKFGDVEPMVFKQGMLKKLFQKTVFAICTDQSRYNLTGLLLEFKAGILTVVATDGRRMSLAKTDDIMDSSQDFKVIVPAKMIHELLSLLGSDDEQTVGVCVEESQIGFFMNNLTSSSTLIEGSFPNYETVIPKKHDKEIALTVEAFERIMRLALAMTNDRFRNVRLAIESGMMRVIVKTPEVGEYEDCTPVEYDGDSVEIAFNPAFILDVLRNIDTEKVCLLLKDTSSPGIIKPYTDAPSDSYVNVVMPIRI